MSIRPRKRPSPRSDRSRESRVGVGAESARRDRHPQAGPGVGRVGGGGGRLAGPDGDAARLGPDLRVEPDEPSGVRPGAGAHRRAAAARGTRSTRSSSCAPNGSSTSDPAFAARVQTLVAQARRSGAVQADLQLPGPGRRDPGLGRPPRDVAAGGGRRAQGRADRRPDRDRRARPTRQRGFAAHITGQLHARSRLHQALGERPEQGRAAVRASGRARGAAAGGRHRCPAWRSRC